MGDEPVNMMSFWNQNCLAFVWINLFKMNNINHVSREWEGINQFSNKVFFCFSVNTKAVLHFMVINVVDFLLLILKHFIVV